MCQRQLLDLGAYSNFDEYNTKDLMMKVIPSAGACGARIEGLDLTKHLSADTVAELRAAWLKHLVLAFPDQSLSDDDLERFSLYFGDFSEDPYLPSLEGREHIVELRRGANETAPIFADGWHTDWSFGTNPPAATILHGIVIPPKGGNTTFINQRKALAAMPSNLRRQLDGKMAIHSAKVAYAPDGLYGEREEGSDRAMKISYSKDAYNVQEHPLIKVHPETGEEAIFGSFGYIIGVADVSPEEEAQLLTDLYNWQTRPEFQYEHQWEEGMLVMWDNRSLLHKANGGYEGHERVLHRTVVA